VDLIAVNASAVGIGAAFLVAILIAAVAFRIHMGLLRQAVEHRQAELRARWATADVKVVPLAESPRWGMLQIVSDAQRWAHAGRIDPSREEEASVAASAAVR
jgi:hypothetical protein